MTLKELFGTGDPSVSVTGIAIDSRHVIPGDLFVAVRGEKTDGRKYIGAAKQKGAVAILTDEPIDTLGLPCVILKEPRQHLGQLSSKVYGHPTEHLTVIGITGTNGKTTTAHMLEWILTACGMSAGNVGTISYRFAGQERPAERTTPEAPELHKLFKEMQEADVTCVVMECSSHALELGRLRGVAMDVAVFTNLTQDHLDFHQTLEKYREAKWRLFNEVLRESKKEKRVAVLNLDDATSELWKAKIGLPTVTYSVKNPNADVFAQVADLRPHGIQATVRVGQKLFEVSSPLAGEHNLSNLLAAMATAHALKLPMEKVIQALQDFAGAPGRLERVSNDADIHVFVDYAHTEDALENVMAALLPLKNKRFIVVFGCGGDRDRTKRPKMGAVVSKVADWTVITSDNPRSENPDAIIAEILAGIPEETRRDPKRKISTIADRREALKTAIDGARPGDIVLIAGKGHETVQEISGVRVPFDDRQVARQCLERRNA